MRITKCDICKKAIAPRTEILQLAHNGNKNYNSFELCAVCCQPILKILQNKKLLKIENKKDGKK